MSSAFNFYNNQNTYGKDSLRVGIIIKEIDKHRVRIKLLYKKDF